VEKNYVFDGPKGPVSLADLFEGRSQLIVYHFMFGPDWDTGCKSCSYVADHYNGAIPHLSGRDVSFVTISRAPLAKLEAFKKRMGWNFNWVSSGANEFNFDFNVSFTDEQAAAGQMYYNYKERPYFGPELQGLSVFARDDAGNVYHTYSTYQRGIDMFIGAYHFLDVVPKGRDEDAFPAPFTMAWVQYHDSY